MADRYDFDAERRHNRDRGVDTERGYQGSEYQGSDYGRQRFGRGFDRGQERNWEQRGFSGNEGSYGNYGRGNYDPENFGRENYQSGSRGNEGRMQNQGNWERGGISTSSWGGADDYRSGRVGGQSYGTDQEHNRYSSLQNPSQGYSQGQWGGAGGMQNPVGGFGGYGAGYGGGLSNYGSFGQNQGRHTGRGPKGYQRSDERIREDINERLTQHPEVDATEIEVQVQNGEVTLTGSVEQRHEKRIAEDIAESVSGVKDVHNQIRLQRGNQSSSAQGGNASSMGATSAGGNTGSTSSTHVGATAKSGSKTS